MKLYIHLRIEKNTTGIRMKVEKSTSGNSSTKIDFPIETKECTTPTNHLATQAETQMDLGLRWAVLEQSLSYKNTENFKFSFFQ